MALIRLSTLKLEDSFEDALDDRVDTVDALDDTVDALDDTVDVGSWIALFTVNMETIPVVNHAIIIAMQFSKNAFAALVLGCEAISLFGKGF